MRQMANNIGGIVRSDFTDTVIFEAEIIKHECNKDIFGGIRETSIEEITKFMNT
jgi:hypothetical protein